MTCPDCGPSTVPHWAERFSVRADMTIGYVAWPLELIRKKLRPLASRARLGRAAPRVARMLAALKLGTVATAPDEKNNWRARVAWEEAARRGIDMREFRPFGAVREIFFATFGGDTIVFDGLPRPRMAHEDALRWMDDKGAILKKFKAAGIPVPQGSSCKNWREAEAAFRSIGGAVIVKPSLGSRSRHTYVHLTDLAALKKAFFKAKELSPRVVVEEELEGFVFRITLIEGQVVGVIRREPPHVTGDGRRALSELIIEENKNPLRRGPHFHEIIMPEHIPLDEIPEAGTMVVLHDKVSRAFGASTTEIENIHPENQKLFLKIATTIGDPLVGVDFMIQDMAESWRAQKCGVIECNSLPFIDLHHYPLRGPSRNVAGTLWGMIFPNSSSGISSGAIQPSKNAMNSARRDSI